MMTSSFPWLVVLACFWMTLLSITPTRFTKSLLVASAVAVNPRHCSGSVRHVHLAVGPDSSTSMIVSFASIPSRFEPPIGGVLIGTAPDQMLDVHLEEQEQQYSSSSSSPTSYNVTVESKKWGNNNVDSENDDHTYWAPFYHHVTITGLQPSTTYYYQPLIRPNKQAFNKYNLRHSSHEQEEELKWEEALEESVLRDDDDEFLEESEEQGRQRQLSHPPYDGSQKNCPSMDKIRSFRTGPPKGTIVANFAIFGDLGQFEHSEELMASLLRRGSRTTTAIDATVLAGDIAYTGADHRRWDTFFDFFDDYPFFEKTPVQIVPGNHDIDKMDWSNEIFLAYENRFRMPRVKPPQLGLYDGPKPEKLNLDQPPYPLPYEWGNAYYSWKYAGAYFIMINAYASMEPNSTQYNWIQEELQTAAAHRETNPWLIVVIHTPIYNTFSLHLHDPQIMAAKTHLEPLFVQHQVNLVFSGHIHAYLRTVHVAMGQVIDLNNPNNARNNAGRGSSGGAPMHITVGAGGRKCEAPFRLAQPEEWVAVRDATAYGYGMLRIHNRTTAEWDWIHTGHADDRDYNQLYHSPETQLPPGPAVDHVFIQNQYYL